MKKAPVALLIAFAAALSCLSGCSEPPEEEETIPPYPVTVEGITVEVRPKAVASLSPELTQILLDLGYQNRIVGYSSQEEIPPPLPEPEPVVVEEPPWWKFWAEAPEPEPVGDPAPEQVGRIGTARDPDYEQIGRLKPEFIFTALPLPQAEHDKLEQVGIRLVVMPPPSTLEEVKERQLSVIRIMEGQLEADEVGLPLTDAIQSSLDYIRGQVPAEKKSFLYVSTLDPLVVTGDTYEGALLSLIGENLAQDGQDYTLDGAALAGLEPDVILYSAPLTREELAASPLFQEKAAVLEDRLLEVDGAALRIQTRDIAESLRDTAKKLYPSVDFDPPPPPVEEETSSEE